jgi:RsiW-degrading membrane proteinase PrsW (M82 family)
MFFIYLIALVGISYLYYRYKAISNKKFFFQSPLFKSLAGSLAILLIAVGIINVFAPSRLPRSYRIATDSLTTTEADTSAGHLLSEKPRYHYELLQKLSSYNRYEPYRTGIRSQYQNFIKSHVRRSRDTGYFGLGVFALINNNYKEALRNFNQITDPGRPYLHYCKGDLYLEQGDVALAEAEFQEELLTKDGNFSESFMRLVDLYEEKENFYALRELMRHEPATSLFPEHLARKTLLYSGDVSEYIFWLFKTIHNQINLTGLIAALAISIVWMVYLARLDIFKGRRATSLLVMFVSGFLSVFVVISFNDVFDLYSSWQRNGEFLNDFYYCFLMIGIPEEFTKIFPLLALLLFVKRLREPIDYLLFASASALGFAFIENLLYFEEITDGIIHGRAYLAAIGHMVDSSFVAYGFVISSFQFRKKINVWAAVSMSFFAGTLSHALYDFLLYQELTVLFFLFFIFAIQVWVILINNCLNNSSSFSYDLASRTEGSRLFISLALTSIFALEYLLIGFSENREQANYQFVGNASSAAFLIIFFSSNLSSFNLVRGYWRDVYFRSREKHGYGSRQQRSLLVSWYLVNSIKPHNYVGRRISIYNDPYNKFLTDVLASPLNGTIVNRIMLYEKGEADPNWFIVKLDSPIPLADVENRYVLVKLRYQEDSLLYEDEVQIFFKAIPDLNLLKRPKRERNLFPFYGWAFMTLQHEEVPS